MSDTKRVLIIEDDQDIAELQKDYLVMSKYDVTIESDGMKGLLKALDEDFDIVILDLMLPSMDGFEVCKRIREEKDTPIIIVSAKKEDIDKIKGFGLGADDYMTKPFSPSELVARVSAHISRFERLVTTEQRAAASNMLEVRGLKLNKETRQVWLNSEEVMLTSKEFELLVFLMEHPNHIYSKDDLFRQVWDEGGIGDIASVTVYVSKLRDKIEVNPSKPQYIETVWGVGYRFKV